jgi:hypothetical protein
MMSDRDHRILEIFAARVRQHFPQSFLTQRLYGARAYDRIAGYFSSSMLKVAGEALETISGPVRIVCNSDLDVRDVETARTANYAMRRAWCAAQPERHSGVRAKERFARLYEFLGSGKRNPLPPASESRDIEILRRSLHMPDDVAVVPGSDWGKLREPDKAHLRRLSRHFAQQHNPFIRHIVRRTREYLETTFDP